MILIFIAYEAYIPADPLIPISLIKNGQFMLFVWFACVGGMLYYALGIVWPTTVATLFTTDLLKQGWLTIAQTGGNQLGNVLCGLAFGSIGRVKYQLIYRSSSRNNQRHTGHERRICHSRNHSMRLH
jgi:hypothetical protein